QSDLGEAHGTGNAGNAARATKIRWSDIENGSRWLERLPAVARDRERDVESLVPDHVLSAVRGHRADDADHSSIVVAGIPRFGADPHRRGPGLASISRAAEEHDGLRELPLDPGNVEVPLVRTLRLHVR